MKNKKEMNAQKKDIHSGIVYYIEKAQENRAELFTESLVVTGEIARSLSCARGEAAGKRQVEAAAPGNQRTKTTSDWAWYQLLGVASTL